ncbi:MAG: SDR family NAD-dependent epimerase/dehydratase, partial [Phenylobacterium sp.]|nr:SDR family NAD-dependent epimerase/dehydratase [Phenylobacterium sp.]
MVKELTGSSSELIFEPLPVDDPKQRKPDITRAQEVLDWTPTAQLREGLGKTIEYFDGLLRELKTKPQGLAQLT